MIAIDRVRDIIGRFADKRILVIGDLMLDEFLWGKVSRISPEAPVPVVDVIREEFFPGGAANVARNLAEFSNHTALQGITGNCEFATRLCELLVKNRINVDGIQFTDDYQTIVKSRVIARNQHIVRIDREKKMRVQPQHRDALLERLDATLPSLDAVIIEDYGKGLLSKDLVTEITARTKKLGKVLTVDPNPSNPITWTGVTAVKPNRSEAFAAAGLPYEEGITPPSQDSALQRVADVLIQKWDTEFLLITLGEQGLMLWSRDGARFHAPTRAREVFDVSGAGDTVIALFTLSLAAGATAEEAAEIANHASGVVVGKLGTATVRPDELIKSFGIEAE